jgi:hypothetical protein
VPFCILLYAVCLRVSLSLILTIVDLYSDHSVYITAATNRFVLLNWVNVLLNCVLGSKSETPTPHAMTLTGCQALLIDGLVDANKKSVAHGAIGDVRRSIRKVDCLFVLAFTCLHRMIGCTTVVDQRQSC